MDKTVSVEVIIRHGLELIRCADPDIGFRYAIGIVHMRHVHRTASLVVDGTRLILHIDSKSFIHLWKALA